MTNHADLIAALRIPTNVTLPGAPELDEYDEQRKAAADAIEAAWAEATAAAYGAAMTRMAGLASAEYSINNTYEGEIFDHARGSVASLTPQSARDWLAAHDAEVYRRGQEDMRERAAEVAYQWWDDDDSQELRDIIRAIPIKEKDDE